MVQPMSPLISKTSIAPKLNRPIFVQVWFQNRRAKWRRQEKMEAARLGLHDYQLGGLRPGLAANTNQLCIRLGSLVLRLLGVIKLSSRVGALAILSSPKLSHHGFRLNSCGLGAQRGHPQRRASPHGQARAVPLTWEVLCARLEIYRP